MSESGWGEALAPYPRSHHRHRRRIVFTVRNFGIVGDKCAGDDGSGEEARGLYDADMV